jgi:hypothetical protein
MDIRCVLNCLCFLKRLQTNHLIMYKYKKQENVIAMGIKL